jgi:hypothetical protein
MTIGFRANEPKTAILAVGGAAKGVANRAIEAIDRSRGHKSARTNPTDSRAAHVGRANEPNDSSRGPDRKARTNPRRGTSDSDVKVVKRTHWRFG